MAARKTASNTKEKLLQLLECHICLGELQDPRLLSCGHVLCYSCVKAYSQKVYDGDTVPCPMCRKPTVLYKGGVDNLPKFFFMHDLKQVVEEEVCEEETDGIKCSVEDCGNGAAHYCQTGCRFLCQHCSDDHNSSRITKSHKVIPASEYEVLCNNKCPYPPCHRHGHQVMDLYCCTCNIPICTTCCQANHRHHDCCELTKQAEVCKAKLQQIYEDTDSLIQQVKGAIDNTKSQAQQADVDIDHMTDSQIYIQNIA